MVATVTPKKATPGGLALGDAIPANWPFAIVTVVSPELKNASGPILVIELGIMIDVKLAHR